MSSTTHAAAAFVLPVSASAAAVVAAFGAFSGRVAATVAVVTGRPRTADLMLTTGWFGGADKRIADGTSYDPQTRGSSG